MCAIALMCLAFGAQHARTLQPAWADEAPAPEAVAGAAQGAGAGAAGDADAADADAAAAAEAAADAALPEELTAEIPEGAGETARDYSAMSLQELTAEVQAIGAQRDKLVARRTAVLSEACEAGTRQAAVVRQLNMTEEAVDVAVTERYKLQRHGVPLIESLLASDSLNTFIAQVRYLESITRVDVERVVRLRQEKTACEQRISQLYGAGDGLEERIARINANLEEAQRIRDEKQRLMDMVEATKLTPDGADWAAGEEKFIEVWAPRLEAYLAGSPLAGQGATFAKAAWDNHIDPRWSAAISTKESSKGRYCIRPHNAWGWGAADSDPYNLASEWATWEQAINAHAAGLVRGYGYTVSVGGAQSYCPPNWEDWYITVVNEMNRI